MNNDKEEQQQTIEALEAELSHYVQLCQSQKELLKKYILLQKKSLQHLQSAGKANQMSSRPLTHLNRDNDNA